MMDSFVATFRSGLCFVSALAVALTSCACADQDAEHGLLGYLNRIDGMAVALEIILLWINREAKNKHFKNLI